MLRNIASCGLLLALLFGAPAAHAHAMLQHATPSAGENLSKAPAHIRLEFSEQLWPNESSVSLSPENGTPLPVKLMADPKDATVLIATPKAPLKAGVYNVTWKVTCIYSHESEGHYTFTVSP